MRQAVLTRRARSAGRAATERAAIERIEQRFENIDAQPVLREHAAVIELRGWLAASFSPVRFYADDRDGPVLAPEASTTPRTIVIEVWLYGDNEYLRFTPRSKGRDDGAAHAGGRLNGALG